MFELRLEDERESSGWIQVDIEHHLGMFVRDSHRDSGVGKDSVTEN